MALIGFEQDPNAPDGAGYFQFDNGKKLYAHDPELAASVRGPDMRTALNGFKTTDQRLDAGEPAPGIQEQLDAIKFRGVPKDAAPAGPPAAAPAGATGGGPPAPTEPQGPGVQQQMTDYVNRPVYSAPTKGGYRPVRESQTVEQEGLPYDERLARQREEANNAVVDAHLATAQAQAHRAQAESLQYQAQLPELQKRAAQAQLDMQGQQDAYKRERADLDRLMAESQQQEKSFNANRWMESKGVVGQIGATIAQAFGAYAATLSHGENWAKKIIDGAIDRDIAEQKAQIDAGKAGVNNALKKLELRYGDMNQAQAALKLAMQNSVDAQIQSYAAATKSDDVKNAAGEWLAQNQKDRVDTEQKFMAASLGKRKTETSGQVVAPSAGGARMPTEKEKQDRLRTIKEGQDVGAMPDTSRAGRELDIKEKEFEAKKKNNPNVAKAQEQLDAINNSLNNISELDKLYAQPGVLSRAQRGRMESLQDLAPLEVHKALTGMSRFTETEGERYKTAYGEKGETLDYTGKHRAALSVLREDLARKKAQLEKAIQSGQGVGAAPEGGEAIKDVE